MDVEPATVSQASARTELIPKIWTDDTKGLRKELINFRFVSMKKPSELSCCLVNISEIGELGGRESNILRPRETLNELWIKMGSAVTPIDCYLERIIMQMFTNEESKCFIACKTNEISFVLRLLRIEDSDYYFSKPPKVMLSLAKQYKENGVKMFSQYPLFAHECFNRAAKCLLSCAPLEDLDPRQEGADTIDEMLTLLETLYLNISACLIKQQRYEEVLHVLEYVDQQEKPSQKAIYRKALAQFHVKQFQEAMKTLERIDYSENKDCVALHQRIKTTWQQEDNKFNSMVKKMFG